VPPGPARSTETLLEKLLATAKSGCESALKSPTATDEGPSPTGMFVGPLKLTWAGAEGPSANSTAASSAASAALRGRRPLPTADCAPISRLSMRGRAMSSSSSHARGRSEPNTGQAPSRHPPRRQGGPPHPARLPPAGRVVAPLRP
jgi:hypothetical protein